MGILHIALILFFATQLHSCTDEHTDHPTPIGEEKMITFSVKVPGGFTPATYALTTDDENAVNTVDVLLFESGGGNYISGPHYGAIGDEDETTNEVDVTIRIPEGLSGYDMVVLANCRSDINGKDFSGDDKATALAKLIWNVKADKTKPNWLEDDGNKTIPMWGEYSSGTVTLTRMLARVNVTNNASASFTLTSVHLCNYNDAGYITPTSSIAAPNQTGFSNAILYSGTTVISDNKCINEIYTFEAATADKDDYNLNSPCLVIGGEYNGETYYYRVDFVKKETDDTYTYLNLLRNHKYEVNIENISGPGYTSAEDALKSRPINVVYDVKDWDDGAVSDVVYDGQYILGVSQTSFSFGKGAESAALTIQTDNPLGWSAKVFEGSLDKTDDDTFWLQINKTTGTNLNLTVGENADAERTAMIELTAGNLKYKVSVAQSNVNINLSVQLEGADVSTLLFAAALNVVPSMKSVTLTWEPSDAKILLDHSIASNPDFTIEESGSSAGTITYNITPNNSISDKTTVVESDIDFALLLDDGTTINKTLSLYQCVPYLDNTSTIGKYYLLNGTNVSVPITFNTNVPWEVKSVTETDAAGDPLSLLTAANKTTIETANGSFIDPGSVILSSVTDTDLGGFVKVVIGTQDNLGVDDITVTVPFAGTLTGKASSSSKDVVWAGSNIYWDEDPEEPGKGKLTFDATPSDTPDASSYIRASERRQGVFFRWGSLYGVSATGSWSSVIYSPDGTSGAASAYEFSSWGDVPSISSSDLSASSTTDSYLYYRTDDRNDPSKAKFGDICRWITLMGWAPDGSKWRMPTGSEFGTVSPANYRVPNGENNTYGAGLSGVVADEEEATFTGTNSNLNSAGIGTIVENRGRFAKGVDPVTQEVVVNASMPFYPAAGSRNGSGSLNGVGLNGYYWSGSLDNSTAHVLYFHSSTANLNYTGNRLSSVSVRCVQE